MSRVDLSKARPIQDTSSMTVPQQTDSFKHLVYFGIALLNVSFWSPEAWTHQARNKYNSNNMMFAFTAWAAFHLALPSDLQNASDVRDYSNKREQGQDL